MADPVRIITFNIHDYVRVKLSPDALLLWKQEAEELRTAYPQDANAYPDTPRLDADGYYRDQLYKIMHLIGPLCVIAGFPIENCEILLEIKP